MKAITIYEPWASLIALGQKKGERTLMNPIKLTGTKPDGTEVSIWACGKCGYVRNGEENAKNCCTCSTCGKELKHGAFGDCDDCRRRKWAEREAERIDKAEKLETWDGWVFYDGAANGNDGYFESLDDLIDWLEGEGIKPENWPEYVFCCKVVPFPAVDLDDIVDRIMDELPEGYEREHLVGLDLLEEAINDFNESNKHLISYKPDYTKVVRVKK